MVTNGSSDVATTIPNPLTAIFKSTFFCKNDHSLHFTIDFLQKCLNGKNVLKILTSVPNFSNVFPVLFFNCCYEQDTRTLKRRMYREVLDSTPGLILLGITFLFQTMPSTYMPVILRQDYGIPESTSAIIISSSTLDIKICLIYGNNQNICWVSVWLNFTVPCHSFLYLFILLGF